MRACVWLRVERKSCLVFLRPSMQACNTWCNNISGSRVVLSPASLLHLTEIERPAAQKAALARLQCLDLGLKINIPKGIYMYIYMCVCVCVRERS